MQNPNNLRVLQEAMSLARLTYGATSTFPPREQFGLSAQMRRAAISIGSNIAEGCGRQGNTALVSFLHIALGSASELEFQSALAVSLEFGRREDLEALARQTMSVKRMLARLIARLRDRPDRAGR